MTFELSFLCRVRWEPISFFSCGMPFPKHHLLDRLFFLHRVVCPLILTVNFTESWRGDWIMRHYTHQWINLWMLILIVLLEVGSRGRRWVLGGVSLVSTSLASILILCCSLGAHKVSTFAPRYTSAMMFVPWN